MIVEAVEKPPLTLRLERSDLRQFPFNARVATADFQQSEQIRLRSAVSHANLASERSGIVS
jgi:hypothetical protein